MPEKKTFCSSPWVHVKLNYSGRHIPCRWQSTIQPDIENMNLRTTSIMEFFTSDRMNKFRADLLNGDTLTECKSCHYEDSFGKVSGRVRQLHRSNLDDMTTFDENYPKSPHYEMFKYSEEHQGQSESHPHDLQINLGNICNSACIMCSPMLSTRLNQDYQRLSKTSPILFPTPKKFDCWSDDPEILDKFIKELVQLPSISYIHLLGGETLLLDSFYTICNALIKSGLSKQIFLGTTTNLTVYSERLEHIIPEFGRFHIGLSIESVNPLNDYIRYPSKINDVLTMLDRFLLLKEKTPSIHLTLRITPNIFSIFYIDEVIQYMCDKNITGESCNILENPKHLRIELLPDDLRLLTIEKLRNVIEKNSLVKEKTVNTRDNNLIKQVIADVAFSYIEVLEKMTLPENSEEDRAEMVRFLNGFESLRNNSILDYAPEFEPFLTQYGYKKITK